MSSWSDSMISCARPPSGLTELAMYDITVSISIQYAFLSISTICSRCCVWSSARIPRAAFVVRPMRCPLPLVRNDRTERTTTMGKLDGKRVAILVANEGIEQVELTEPRKALEEAGATVDLIAPEAGEAQAFNHLDKGDTFPVDKAVGDASADDYDALMLPGGVANPDNLRTDEAAVAFARAFFDAGKPVAAICHAPWT